MFEFVDRNQKGLLVMLTGWAFDCSILTRIDLPYNYLLYNSDAADFENRLKQTLNKIKTDRISLLGFSQGAFAAYDFACNNPDVVERLILVSSRQRYEPQKLENIKHLLAKNNAAYLYKFYKDCFCKNESDLYRWFRDSFLHRYLEQMTRQQLIKELDYLGGARICPRHQGCPSNVTLIHGREDKIAPVAEAIRIAEDIPQARLKILEMTGHLPFLKDDFIRCIYED